MSEERARKLREYGLTAGTLGSNGAQTAMVVLLPVLLQPHAPSTILIGIVIGSEGLMAILIPYWIGWLSDALPKRWADRFGRRTLFLWLMAPIMAAALVVAPFLDGFWPPAIAAFVFFAAFHGHTTPLWALMIDAVPDERRSEVQGVRGGFQAAGLAFGLIGGGLLFALWQPLPFLVAAALVLATTWLTVAAAPADRRAKSLEDSPGEGGPSFWKRLADRPSVLWFLVANALWDGAVDGIRPFIFIFALVVLGITMAEASLVLGVLLGGLGLGAVVIGRLGQRFGRARLLAWAAGATGVAMALGVLVRDVPSAIGLLAVAGIAGAAFIALPFPLFSTLAGEEAAGRQTGVYIISLGVARLTSPILVGAAIDFGAAYLPEYEGYPFMWPVAGLLALLSIPALLRAVKLSEEPEERL